MTRRKAFILERVYAIPETLVSCRADLIVMKSLIFCLSKKILISFSLLKNNIFRYRNLAWFCFQPCKDFTILIFLAWFLMKSLL